MGTSSSHRSPSTPEWERVKRLYREPNPDPRRVASRIVSALGAGTRAEMSGAGVACCLSNLLRLSQQIATKGLPAAAIVPGLPPLLSVPAMLREETGQEIARRGLSSAFTPHALGAQANAASEAGSSGAASTYDISAEQFTRSMGAFALNGRLHDLSLCFLGHDIDQVFRGFIARDIHEAIGGESLPGRMLASQLSDAVASHCRHTVAKLVAADHEQALHDALSVAEPRLDRIQATLAELTEMSLQKLAVGE